MNVLILGCMRTHGGTTVITNYIKRILDLYGISNRIIDITLLSTPTKLIRSSDVVFVVGGWYIPVYLCEPFIREVKKAKKPLVGYLVTEAPIPPILGRRILPHFDKIIVPSKFVEGHYRAAYEGDIKRIYHGVDTELFSPSEKEPEYDVAVVMPVTSLYWSHRKGLDITHDVIAILRSEGYKVIANEYAGLKEVDCSFPRVPYEELPNLYRSAKVFLWMSRCEGFGLPVLEAMSCGLPCVYSDAPAHSEFAVGLSVPTTYEGVTRPKVCPTYYEVHEITSIFDVVEKVRLLLENDSLREVFAKIARNRARELDYRVLYHDIVVELMEVL